MGAFQLMAKLKEACGVAAFMLKDDNSNEAAYLSYICLNALQHRGQESAGIASFDNENKMSLIKDMGLVSHVINQQKLSNLKGHLALGHVRYSTTGKSEVCNAQPFALPSSVFGHIALGHNGNLVNTQQLITSLTNIGTLLSSNTDSEVLVHLINNRIGNNKKLLTNEDELLLELKEALTLATGAFSLGISLGGEYLVAARDSNGLRPLCLGALETDGEIQGYTIASESCALEVIGAKFVREIEAGEILLINKKLETKSIYLAKRDPKFCLFELIYFARPDSDIHDVQVYSFREQLGRELALAAPPPPQANVVIGVPDSGTPAAIGYAQQAGIPFSNGLVKNRYVGRTFIQPTQAIRQLGIKMKLNPLPKLIAGKSVVIIDDSIVRGNTPRQLVKLVKQAGASEVHLRISSPPIMWGCFYGIAMKDHELIARRLEGDVERIRQEVGADSLAYISLDRVLAATRKDANSF
ncbi:MAG TPA: amidophosphoribosyltransferase, partial [Vampirovibrionales bacterium]